MASQPTGRPSPAYLGGSSGGSGTLLNYKGTWNADTNTPTLANTAGTQGDYYICTEAGSVNFGAGSIAFVEGNACVYNGTAWQNAGSILESTNKFKTATIASLSYGVPSEITVTWDSAFPIATQHISVSYTNDQNLPIDIVQKQGTLSVSGAIFVVTSVHNSLSITNISISFLGFGY